MGSIRVLDEKTVNKIAAGEVIEKPASIVKELVENSIDAGADEISVDIMNGGISYIKVCDNGSGIPFNDIETAFLRHATSKIENDTDLNNIITLGFRGEALASIAAVSKVEMISRTKNDTLGSKIHIEGGRVISKEYFGSPYGTIITIKDVFFNTPARLKFLKSESREGMYITEVMQNLAMSNTHISFKYKLNDKLIFATHGDNDLKSVILAIYGKDVIKNIIELNYKGNITTIKGYIGNSNIAKGNRSSQSIFVNKRYVKSRIITAAAESAYKSIITNNKYPFFVIDIILNPEFVDVNVHPAKSEVRFQDDNAVFKDVFNSVKEALSSQSTVLDFNESRVSIIKELPKINYEQQSIPINNEKINENRELVYNEEKTFNSLGNNICIPNFTIQDNSHKNTNKNREPKFEPLSIIGQMHLTYIIAEGRDELYIIDQHAAHERIFYEKYLDEFNESGIFRQNLAIPLIIVLSYSEKQLVLENISFFEKFGYKIEDFGGNSLSLREVPVIYGNPNLKELFFEIVSILNNKEFQRINIIDRIIFTLACKSAVKAGDKLNYREMFELVDKLRYCDNPFTCPHGRPTIIKITVNELEKRFKRIQ